MNKKELVAYSMSFASYLVENASGIRSIVLFGSVARGQFDSESDIDIFIDTHKKTDEKRIQKLLEKFRKTQAHKNWRLKGVSSEIRPIAGNLTSKEWESLHTSICSDGIVLYGKYESEPKDNKHYMIFSFGKIKEARKRVNLHRNLFGYRLKGKKYPGLAERVGGEKIGSGVLLIPISAALEVKELFRKHRIPVKIFEIWK